MPVLKLEGLKEAPVHLAVLLRRFGTHTGEARPKKSMMHKGVFGAIKMVWLASNPVCPRMGWVSILDPAAVTKGARRAEVVEPRGLPLPRASGRGASRSRARAASLGTATPTLKRRRVHTLDSSDRRLPAGIMILSRQDAGGPEENEKMRSRLDAFHTGCHFGRGGSRKGSKGNAVHVLARNPAAAPATVSGELATEMPLEGRKASGKAVESDDPQARRPATSSGHTRTHWAGCPDVETDQSPSQQAAWRGSATGSR